MQNRLQVLIDRVSELRHALRNTKPRQAANITAALKNAVARLNSFGSRLPIVKVHVVTEGQSYEIYYTEISVQEAIEYTRLKMKRQVLHIEAFAIPSGKAIKL